MAPVPGPDSPPESARKVRSAAACAARVLRLSLQGAGLRALLITTTAGLFRFHRGWRALLGTHGVDPNDPLADLTVYKSSTFIAGIVVALMIMPIISSVMRESFSQAPVGEREGAFALGATRWGMIRSVVLPFGRGGMIGGTMLGLGRALGETIGVYLVISPVFVVQPHIFQSGTSSVSSLIALRYGEA